MSPSLARSSSKEIDDASLPALDFSKAMRGVYAHRMGENFEDERRAAEFWQGLGFAVESIESANDRFSRRPDLLLLQHGKPVAYCEVKTIQPHRHHIRILHEDREVEERTELSAVSVEERLSTDLVTAIRQLNYVNLDHALLNFAVLVNRDPEATPTMLAKLFAKQPPVSRRTLQARRAAWMVQAIQDFRCKVDLCLWVDGLSGFSVIAHLVGSPSLRDKVEKLTGLGLENIPSLETAA
jgi:hypothetical protein